MNYAIAIIHKVTDLPTIKNFMNDSLEFTPSETGDNFVVMQNGALNIRLIADENNTSQRLHLDFSSDDLENTIASFLTKGFAQLGQIHWLNTYRKQVDVQNKYFKLTIFQEYNEDELGIMLPLEVSLDWHDNALTLTQYLVKVVPVSFRDVARKKIIACAEADTVVAGLFEVNQTIAIQAVIKSTPLFQHTALRDELTKHGLHPNDHFLED